MTDLDMRQQTTQINSAFYPSGASKSSTGLVGWGQRRARVHLCRMIVTSCDPTWQLADAPYRPSFETSFHEELQYN